MAQSQARKAAMLLMMLDPKTSSELLMAVSQEMLTQIAAEFATLGTVDPKSKTAVDAVQEFAKVLSGTDAMLGKMLGGVMDSQRSGELLNKAYEIIQSRDPFVSVRSVEPEQLAGALMDESPQVIGLILTELTAEKAGKVLMLMGDEMRKEIVTAMACAQEASPDAKTKVASNIREKIKRLSQRATSIGRDYRKEQLRRVALLLQGVRKSICDMLLANLLSKDQDVGKAVRNLMVVWEDIPRVADRSMQEALHVMDSRQIALALVDADDSISKKIKGNLSQRALAMLEEEISIMPAAKPEEIEEAREICLGALREMNENNMLAWI